MRRHTLGWLLLSAGLTLTGCAQTLEGVLNDQRGTEEWRRANAAFKEIMRNYVHGANEHVSEEQLEREFLQYVTLTKQDVRSFVDGQSCVPEAGAGEARYYLVNVAHQRHDPFYAPQQALPITGTGTQNAHATFSANVLLERQTIGPATTMPKRAIQPGAPFPSWESISKAMTDQAAFDATFKLSDETQRQQIFARTSSMDWAQSVTGELFIAPALAGGDIFSPALFAVYLFRPEPSAQFSVFLVVSADAGGRPKSSYVGLIDSERQDYKSLTGFAFTYLSAANNLLNYAVVMTATSPLTFELQITSAYPTHADTPYLTVHAAFAPATSPAMIAAYQNIPGAKLILMIRKGALMRDLIAMYFPNSTSVELWKNVGALNNDKTFMDKLAAVGLDAAAGLFEADLWIERPQVSPAGRNSFAVSPAMELKCSAKRATAQ